MYPPQYIQTDSPVPVSEWLPILPDGMAVSSGPSLIPETVSVAESGARTSTGGVPPALVGSPFAL